MKVTIVLLCLTLSVVHILLLIHEPTQVWSFPFFKLNCVTQLKLYTVDKLSSPIFCCLSVCEESGTLDFISTFPNIYRHKTPLLTLYHLIPSSINLYWPSTSQYRHILTQYHQVPLIIDRPVWHSSANWIISLFTAHLMSHAQYKILGLVVMLIWCRIVLKMVK